MAIKLLTTFFNNKSIMLSLVSHVLQNELTDVIYDFIKQKLIDL